MEIIQAYKEAQLKLEQDHRNTLENEIRHLLSQLDEGETIPLNSANCDGDGIAVLTYSDAINKVNRDGSCIIYNNNQCHSDFGSGASNDGNDVFGFPLEVTVEILECVRMYMSKRLVNKQAKVIKIELEKIAIHFDSVQNMSQDFFGRDCKLFHDISDVRSEIENIKDRISEDLTTYIK